MKAGEVILLIVVLLGALLANGCTTTKGKEPVFCPTDMKECPDGSSVSRDPENNCQFRACPPAEKQPKDILFQQQDTVKEFTITARQFEFEPATITVKQGDKVRLKVTSTDVEHGFSIKEYNINKNLRPGKTETIEFVADKAGEFEFRCSVYCGSGHPNMEGKLIVQ